MKRNLLTITILLVWTISAFAQRYTIYTDEFRSDIRIPNRALNIIRMAFLDGIRNTNRVNVIDATAIHNDLTLSPMEEARRYRAEYLLVGRLLKREATDDGISQRHYHSRENSFKEKFTLRLDLIRTSDGVTISTRNYEETGSSSGRDASQYGALENAVITVPYQMSIFVENYFKVYGSIIRMAATGKDRAKTVYVNLGYDDPIKEGVRMNVMEDGTLDGNFIERKIGEVRIKDILGPKVSLCKVNKGEKEVYEALQAGKTLRLVSREAKLFDE